MRTDDELPYERDAPFSVDVGRYTAILAAQWPFVATFCLSAILASLALTYVFSEQYRATTTIYYHPVDVTLLQRTPSAFGGPAPSVSFKIISQTLNDVVKSDAVVGPVVQKLHLDVEEPEHYTSWYREWFGEAKRFVKRVGNDASQILMYGRTIDESPTAKAMRGLSEAVEIASNRDSYIFLLAAKDKSPERAARIVDALAAQLVEWSQQQEQNPAQRNIKRFTSETNDKEAEIARLRHERDDILRGNNIISVNQEVTTGVQSLYELKLERERIGAEVREKQKRLDEIAKAVETRPTRYMDPDEFKRLQQERTFADIELQSITAKRAAIEASIERMQQRLQSVLAVKKQIESIDSKIDNASRTLVQIGDLQLDAVEGRNRASAVKVLQPAAIPDKPVQPIKIYHVGLTAVLSLFFSIGLVYLFSYFNVRALLPSREDAGEREDGEAAAAHG